MYKKKVSLLIVAVLLLSMVLTGCNADTLGFVNYLEEMQTVATSKAIQTVSTISIGDVKVPADMFSAEETALMTTVNTYLKDNYITITQKSDTKKNVSFISFDLVEKKNNKKENLATLKYKDEAFAISISPKFNELYPGITVVAAPFNNKLIPLSTIKEVFADAPLALNALSDPKSLEGVQEKSSAFLKEFTAIYKEADTNLITKEGNAFVLQVETEDLVKLANTFVTIGIKNFDKIIDTTITFMDSLTDEEFNAMYATTFPEGKKQIVDLLKEAKLEFAKEGMADEILASWNAGYAEGADMVSTMLAGSSLRMRTWKENNKYYTNLYNVIKVSDPTNSSVMFNATILVKEETQVLADGFDVTMPTEEISKELLGALVNEI